MVPRIEGKTIATLRLTSYPDGGVTGGFEPPLGRSLEPFEPTAVMEKVSHCLESQPRLTKRALRSAAGGNADTVDHAVELLISRGYVTVEKVGNTHQHHSVKPYRQHEPHDQTDPNQTP